MDISSRALRFLTLALFVGTAASCTPGLKSNVSWDQAVDFEELRTFSWNEPNKDADPRLNDPVVHKRLRAAVEEELAGKGIRRSQTASPDMQIGYRFKLTSSATKSQKEDVGYRDEEFSTVRMTTPYVRQRDIGRLVLEMFDPETGDVIWKGVAKTEVNFQQSTSLKGETAATAARTLLQKFPPHS